jgi:LuxR family maltose regulon positive regulatory protein
LPVAGAALIGLGEVARESNDLDAAVQLLEEGIALTAGWSEIAGLDGHIALARTALARRETQRGWAQLEVARSVAERFDATTLDDEGVALVEAKMRLAEGDRAPVWDWARSAGLESFITTPLQETAASSYEHRVRKYQLVVFARLLLAEGRPHDALAVLDPIIRIARWRDRRWLLAEVQVVRALAYNALGLPDRALEALGRALRIAEDAGLVRTLLDEGEPVRVLLRKAVETGSEGSRYAGHLLAQFAPEEPRGAASGSTAGPLAAIRRGGELDAAEMVEALSDREGEVLRHLATHLTSTEIADQLFISSNTVRFHIKNIYSKLGVHSRADAINRARELGLL